jgi:hypothetical protein
MKRQQSDKEHEQELLNRQIKQRRMALKDPPDERTWSRRAATKALPSEAQITSTWRRLSDLAVQANLSFEKQWDDDEDEVASFIDFFGVWGVDNEEPLPGTLDDLIDNIIGSVIQGNLRTSITHTFWHMCEDMNYVINVLGPSNVTHYNNPQLKSIRDAITGDLWGPWRRTVSVDIDNMIGYIETLVNEIQPQAIAAFEKAVAYGWRSKSTIDNAKHTRFIWKEMLSEFIRLKQILAQTVEDINVLILSRKRVNDQLLGFVPFILNQCMVDN